MNRRSNHCLAKRLVAHTLAPLLVSGVVALGSAIGLVAQVPLTQMYHKTWTARDGAPNNINGIASSAEGFLWLASDDGLYRFDGGSLER